MKKEELNIKILETLLEIPKWKVTTYKNLAYKFDVHPRKIAQTMKNNKEPEIYPCYKVIAANWKIWGYSWAWWIWWKVWKIKADWVEIIDWKIDDKYIINFDQD